MKRSKSTPALTSERRRTRRPRLLGGLIAVAMGTGAGVLPTPTAGSVSAAGLQVVPMEAVNASHVVLGSLASRSQRKPVTIAGIGPYTISGTDSTTGQPYSFVTDYNYSPSTTAYARESDERTLSGGFTATSGANATYLGRSGVIQLGSGTNCVSPNNFGGITTYCSVFGPEVYSAPFAATVGQAVSFDWSALRVSDDYEIYAYLVGVAEVGAGVFDYGTTASHTLLTYGRGQDQGWTTASGDVPADGTYRFRFVNGSFDGTGGYALGSNMYIDSSVRVGLSNPITFAPLGDKVIGATPFTLSATAPGGAVTFTSATPTKCNTSGNEVTLVDGQTGICTIVANQAGDGIDYVPAETVTRSFAILAAATAPTNSGVPLIQGTVAEGVTLTMTEGTWGDGGSPITGTGIQWFSTVGGVSTPIPGMTGSTCLLIPLADSAITVTVTKTNAIGSTPATSAATISGYTCGAPPVAPGPASEPKINIEVDAPTGKLLGGSKVTVTAEGLAPNSPVTVRLGDSVLGTLTTDSTGALDGQLDLPADVAPGKHELTATGTAPGNGSVGAATSVVADLGGRRASGGIDEGYVSLDPLRVMDTRLAGGALGAGQVRQLEIDDSWGIGDDATSVVINLTVTGPDQGGWIVAYPCGDERPWASTANFNKGDTVANSVTVAVNGTGAICLYSTALTDVVVDLNGFHSPSAEDRLVPHVPNRLLDTREQSMLSSGETVEIGVIGPDAAAVGTSAVVLNVTAVGALTDGFVTIYPCGQPRPLASSLNFAAGSTVANQVFAKVGYGGKVCAYVQYATHLIVDLNAAFAAPGISAYGGFVPTRVLDTRETGPKPGAGHTIELALGVGAMAGVTAFALNVTTTGADASGFITVYPCESERPWASNVNFRPGRDVANHATATVDAAGKVCLFTSASTHVVIDVEGAYL